MKFCRRAGNPPGQPPHLTAGAEVGGPELVGDGGDKLFVGEGGSAALLQFLAGAAKLGGGCDGFHDAPDSFGNRCG